MDIIPLDDPAKQLDQHGHVLRPFGTLHAARPREPGSDLPVSFTFCGEPTGRMDKLAPRTPGPDTPVYPPNLEGKALMCSECERLARG